MFVKLTGPSQRVIYLNLDQIVSIDQPFGLDCWKVTTTALLVKSNSDVASSQVLTMNDDEVQQILNALDLGQ